MTFFEQLYSEEICPIEVTPKTERYRQAKHRLSEVAVALDDALTDEQKLGANFIIELQTKESRETDCKSD